MGEANQPSVQYMYIKQFVTDILFHFLLFVQSLAGGDRVVGWCRVNFQCRGILLIWIMAGHWPTVLAVGAGGGCLDIFFSLFFPPLFRRWPDID